MNSESEKMSFREIIKVLAARYGQFTPVEFYDKVNDNLWQEKQLADALEADDVSLDAPYFTIDGDIIHENSIVDDAPFQIDYRVILPKLNSK